MPISPSSSPSTQFRRPAHVTAPAGTPMAIACLLLYALSSVAFAKVMLSFGTPHEGAPRAVRWWHGAAASTYSNCCLPQPDSVSVAFSRSITSPLVASVLIGDPSPSTLPVTTIGIAPSSQLNLANVGSAASDSGVNSSLATSEPPTVSLEYTSRASRSSVVITPGFAFLVSHFTPRAGIEH